MVKFKRYERIIDERAKSDDPQVQEAADSLLDKQVEKAVDKLTKENQRAQGLLPLGIGYDSSLVRTENDDAEFIGFREAARRFFKITIVDPSMPQCKFLVSDEEFADFVAVLSAAMNEFIRLKKSKWKFTEPMLAIMADFSSMYAQVGLIQKDEKENHAPDIVA